VGCKEKGKLAFLVILSGSSILFLIQDRSYASGVGNWRLNMEECGCDRVIQVNENLMKQKLSRNESHIITIPFENTTCGIDAFNRGGNQKVISFTFFESSNEVPKNDNIRGYFMGIRENLNLIHQYYPGYVMRLYYQASKTVKEQLCEIACSESSLDLCPASAIPKLGGDFLVKGPGLQSGC